MNTHKQLTKDLSLILMYLLSFEVSDEELLKTWKKYDYNIINDLSAENLVINMSRRTQSLYLTDEGIKKAKSLIKKYNL